MISATETGLILLGIVICLFFWLRPRRDSAGTPKSNLARLARIRNASLIFQTLTWLSLILGAYWFLAFLFGWPFPINDKLRVVISHKYIYESPAEMPPAILNLWIVQKCLAFAGIGMLLRLFQLYGRGILFTAKNVLCLRFFGWWLIVNWAVDYQMQGLLRDMDLSMTPVFAALLIIFIAWIMDEGRKIQEEQELTV